MIEIEPTFISENKSFAMGIVSMKEHTMRLLNPAYLTLFICQKGRALVSLYNKKHLFREGDILVAYWDMRPVFLNVSADFETFYCMMSESFLYGVYQNVSTSFCDVAYAYPVLRPANEYLNLLSHWLEQVQWIDTHISGESREIAAKNEVHTLFLAIDNESQKIVFPNAVPTMPRAQEIVRNFCILLEKHSKQYHTVAFYADKLNITPYYLSTITAQTVNDTPKGMIDKQLIIQMKSLLSTTNTPLKIIAEQLYFEDTSYMCRFFRRHTGMSPSEYREKKI